MKKNKKNTNKPTANDASGLAGKRNYVFYWIRTASDQRNITLPLPYRRYPVYWAGKTIGNKKKKTKKIIQNSHGAKSDEYRSVSYHWEYF